MYKEWNGENAMSDLPSITRYQLYVNKSPHSCPIFLLPPTSQYVLSNGVWSFQPEHMLILQSLSNRQNFFKKCYFWVWLEMWPAELKEEQTAEGKRGVLETASFSELHRTKYTTDCQTSTNASNNVVPISRCTDGLNKHLCVCAHLNTCVYAHMCVSILKYI